MRFPARGLAGALACAFTFAMPVAHAQEAPATDPQTAPAPEAEGERQPDSEEAPAPADEQKLDRDSARPERVPGSRVSLVKPEGFVVSETFSGLQAIRGRARIVITEIPRPYSEVLPAYSDEGLRKQGMTPIERKETRISDLPAQLLTTSSQRDGRKQRHWIATVGTPSASVVIFATSGEIRAAQLDRRMRETLLTARWDPMLAIDPFEGFDFNLRGETGMVTALRVGSELTFTKDGVLPIRSPEDPAIVVRQTPERVADEARASYCVEALQTVDVLKDSKLMAAQPIQVDGLPGCEALASGQEAQGAASLIVYRAALFGRESTYLFQGRVGLRHQWPWLPRFRDMVGSFKKR